MTSVTGLNGILPASYLRQYKYMEQITKILLQEAQDILFFTKGYIIL